MKNNTKFYLNVSGEQRPLLMKLHSEFAKLCNEIAKVARDNHCWNRVALHHLVYHPIRQAHPTVGSQMICNAIYAVCRLYRKIQQDVIGPNGDVPAIHFLPNAPVYFDKHMLSIKGDVISMYTLNGRVHFSLTSKDLMDKKSLFLGVKEILLISDANEHCLIFNFESDKGKCESMHKLISKFVDIHEMVESHQRVA